MKFNFDFVLGVAYIAAITALGAAEVGQTAPATHFDWWLPLELFGVVLLPFVLGLFAGFDMGKTDE